MGRFSALCFHPLEVNGWHFVGCSVAMECEAIGPTQDVVPHTLTEQLLVDTSAEYQT